MVETAARAGPVAPQAIAFGGSQWERACVGQADSHDREAGQPAFGGAGGEHESEADSRDREPAAREAAGAQARGDPVAGQAPDAHRQREGREPERGQAGAGAHLGVEVMLLQAISPR